VLADTLLEFRKLIGNRAGRAIVLARVIVHESGAGLECLMSRLDLLGNGLWHGRIVAFSRDGTRYGDRDDAWI
jgi:hypothetical protein